MTLDAIDGLAAALGATTDLALRWQGEGMDRLLDEGHARLVDAVVRRLVALGWDVAVEVSFSRYGERGFSPRFAGWTRAGNPPDTVRMVDICREGRRPGRARSGKGAGRKGADAGRLADTVPPPSGNRDGVADPGGRSARMRPCPVPSSS